MPNVVVLGGLGFVGAHLCNELAARKYTVTAVDIDTSRQKNLCGQVAIRLEDMRLIKESHKDYQCVFNLATPQCANLERPKSCLGTTCRKSCAEVNIFGTQHLVQTFPRVRFINVSSYEAMGAKSVFGITLHAGEQIANLHSNCLNVRLMNIFGEHDHHLNSTIMSFMKSIKHKLPVTIHGNGDVCHDYTYVIDVVDELIRLAEGKRHGVTEIGYQDLISHTALFSTLCELSKQTTAIKYEPSRKTDKKLIRSKYKITEPRYGFLEGLRRTVRWCITNKEF